MSLIFTVGEQFQPEHLNALANCVGVNMDPAGSSTTTSSSFANTPANSQVSFTKVDADSRLRVDFHVTCYVTGSAVSFEFAVEINGTDYPVIKGQLDTVSLHKQFSGVAAISSIATGTHIIQARWKRSSGGGTLTIDNNDKLSFAVTEIQD